MVESTPSASVPGLAKLCEACSVLRFNDELLAGDVKEYPDGSSYLDLSSLFRVSYDDPDETLPLRWHITDSLPELLRLQENAESGCDFCRMLRRMIVETNFDFVGPVELTLSYAKEITALVASIQPLEPQVGWFSMHDIYLSNLVFTLETDSGMFCVLWTSRDTELRTPIDTLSRRRNRWPLARYSSS